MQQLRTLKSWYGRLFAYWDGVAGLDQDLVHMDNHLPNITFAGAVAAGTATAAAAGTAPGVAQLFEDGTYAVTSKNAAGNLVAIAYAAKKGALACDGFVIYKCTGNSWSAKFDDAAGTKNAVLVAEAMKKIRAGTCKIVAQGNSMTRGTDSVSADTIPPVAPHVSYTVPLPYPETFIAEIEKLFGVAGNTIINQGYGGHTAKDSYEYWTASTGADVALVMMGSNDGRVEGGISLADYAYYMGAIIQRFNTWGTGVIILLAPQVAHGTEYATPNRKPNDVELYRSIDTKLGCPFFDTSEVVEGYPYDIVYSDTVHFKQLGYTLAGVDLGSAVLGGILSSKPNVISDASTLLFTQSDNVATTGDTYIFDTSSEVSTDATLRLTKGTSQIASLAFYLDAPAAFVTLNGQLAQGQNITFNGGAQPQPALLEVNAIQGTSSYTISKALINSSEPLFLGKVMGRGWHSVRITAPSAASAENSYLQALHITPVPQHACSDVVYHREHRSFSLYEPVFPAPSLPAASSANVITIPASQFGGFFPKNTTFVAAAALDLCITNIITPSTNVSYTFYKVRRLATGNITATLISGVGANQILINSITAAETTLDTITPASIVTFNLTRTVAGYMEMEFKIPEIFQGRNVALM